jgi:hypothetical protein
LRSPVRANRTPGSVRGAPGNRCPYLDNSRELERLRSRVEQVYGSHSGEVEV